MILTTEFIPTTGILPNSKKIKKFRTLKDSDSQDKGLSPDGDFKKYKTVDSVTKRKILQDLKKTIVVMKTLSIHPEDLSTEELLEILEEIELTQYNKLLAEVLVNHFENFDATTKNLTQWRRKIKGWVNSADKPENRGGLLIAHDRLPIFRDRVINILKNMKARVFPQLRERILKILEEFHYEGKDPNVVKEFNRNTCSKHWWFNFMRRNNDIKELWESIPLERMMGKDKSSHNDSANKDLSTDVSSPRHYPSSIESNFDNLTLPPPFRFEADPFMKFQNLMSMTMKPIGGNEAPPVVESNNNNNVVVKELPVKKEPVVVKKEPIVKKEIVKKETMVKEEDEETTEPMPSLPKESMFEEILPKIEENPIGVQIKTKKEESAMKIESDSEPEQETPAASQSTTPGLPNIPHIPNMPNMSNLSNMLNIPNIANIPNTPQMNYLRMLLQKRSMIDMLIFMQLQENKTLLPTPKNVK